MSIIPLTTKTPRTNRNIPEAYTVVGGSKTGYAGDFTDLSLLILNRGGRLYNSEYLKTLDKMGFQDILWVEEPPAPREVEQLSRQYPKIRFLILKESCSPGEKINLGIREAAGKYVLTMWNDMAFTYGGFSGFVREKLHHREEVLLCMVPALRNSKNEIIPVLKAPIFHKKHLKILSLVPDRSEKYTLFPSDYSGIYHREKFILTGGYDALIPSPYWQKMDFGFRAYMWGEKILCETAFVLHYLWETPSEDTTPDESYQRFYLKNLMVRFDGNSGSIPGKKFWPYFFRIGGGLMSCRRQFKEIQELVKLHELRYRYDAFSVTDLWEEDI